ncbi:MAG: sigma-70 family RNA polymerase sigma factor [Candidatus Peribacteraceae bacterium]|nr:sigma-70 family RNA polymerase sigma factor [Candidatus Peribacteraceae bacterium]
MSVSSLPPEELQSLVLRAQDGDTDAFGKIYDAFLTPIYRYVVFRFPQELAEDLVADVFVKAWEKLHTYRQRSGIPFSAWLFRIARYSIIDAYRATRGFAELSEEMVDEDRENDPQLRTERGLSISMVRDALKKLPKDYRDVLLLHFIAGLGHHEIGSALGMTEGYVRILKFRGLKKLEQLLPLQPQDIPNTQAPLPNAGYSHS